MRTTTLSHLNNAELLRHLEATMDSMTETIVEIELKQRLERANQTVEDLGGYDSAERIIDGKEMLAILDEEGISNGSELIEKLRTHSKFYALADEAGDLFQRLTDLQRETI